MKKIILGAVAAMMVVGAMAQGAPQKVVYEPLSQQGNMKIDNVTLDGFTIFTPVDIDGVVAKSGPLPVVIFGNGGCSHDSKFYWPMFESFVDNGYLVISVGEKANPAPQPKQDPGAFDFSKIGREDNLLDALNWACEANADPYGPYFHKFNCNKVALSGHSCGGAQALCKSYDPRVTTTIMFNSGIGDMQMAGADVRSLENVHAPMVYIIGGPEDVAYPNANLDFERLNTVPVACVNFPVGHGGTYGDPQGGILGEVALQWLDWQLKGNEEASKFFTAPYWRQAQYPTCDYKSKNL